MEPTQTRFAPRAAVAAADHLASEAGVHMLRLGGSAADAAVAASAVMGVTSPHLCGMGGDLFALVHVDGIVYALAANGAAGSGASSGALRAAGLARVPAHDHIAATPMPGCVDGWIGLHRRFGKLPLATVLAPAVDLAAEGFPASPTLAASVPRVADRRWAGDLRGCAGAPGSMVRRPGVARSLQAIVERGRAGWYEGEFGTGLVALGAGHFSDADLLVTQDRWVEPLAIDAFGVTLWTVPAPSQGYLCLAGAAIAERSGLLGGVEVGSAAWAHALIEAARAAGHDRESVLHEHASGDDLLDPSRLAAAVAALRSDTAATYPDPRPRDGDTTYLCAVDSNRMGVSLIQSNAGGFGSGLGIDGVGVGLQNRGQGFSLEAGHPAEIGPGRRPPHTLSPLLATRGEVLAGVLGTMGGDAQPQVLLQLIARIFGAGRGVGESIAAGRFMLRSANAVEQADGFATWRAGGRVGVDIEGHAPQEWASELAKRGHDARRIQAFGHGFGHAQAILVRADGIIEAASDPRSLASAAIGF